MHKYYACYGKRHISYPYVVSFFTKQVTNLTYGEGEESEVVPGTTVCMLTPSNISVSMIALSTSSTIVLYAVPIFVCPLIYYR